MVVDDTDGQLVFRVGPYKAVKDEQFFVLYKFFEFFKQSIKLLAGERVVNLAPVDGITRVAIRYYKPVIRGPAGVLAGAH